MPHSALQISGEILKRAKEKGIEISNMKLQKLLYIANGIYLAQEGNPLIEEPIEVWTYGPVIKNVYHEFKNYGNQNITNLPLEYQFVNKVDFDKVAEESIDFSLDVANKLTAIQLSNWTHDDNSPWTKAKKKDEKIISEKEMKEFFMQFFKPAV